MWGRIILLYRKYEHKRFQCAVEAGEKGSIWHSKPRRDRKLSTTCMVGPNNKNTLLPLETNVSYTPGGYSVSVHDGGWKAQSWWVDGSQARGNRKNREMPDLCWKHDKLPWPFWSHRTIQASVPCWISVKDSEDIAMCLPLLLKTAD